MRLQCDGLVEFEDKHAAVELSRIQLEDGVMAWEVRPSLFALKHGCSLQGSNVQTTHARAHIVERRFYLRGPSSAQ